MRSSYGGCKSWVELETDLETDGAMPVLSEENFMGRLNEFPAALEAGPAAPRALASAEAK